MTGFKVALGGSGRLIKYSAEYARRWTAELKPSKLKPENIRVPASSAPWERAFSVCGHILEEKRSCRKPQSLSNIPFFSARS